MFNDLMSNIEWLFSLHDKDRDGYLTRDEVLQLSESLLVSFVRLDCPAHRLGTLTLSLHHQSSFFDPKWVMHISLPWGVS